MNWMNSLDQVPFQTQLGPLDEEVRLVTAPDIVLPDWAQILRETEVFHFRHCLSEKIFSHDHLKPVSV